jgi:SAM-dependent methyltransferase
MESGVYEAEARVEASHWWFTGRRKLFSRTIRALDVGPRDAVLDVGTSTGTNLRMLDELGFQNVTGLDASEDAVRFCAAKGLGQVRLGDITGMPFADETFSLVLATDILEHVDDDEAALAEVHRVLKPEGTTLITVPAFSSLWGFQDEVSHHKRRYRMKPLLERIRGARLEPVTTFYFNYLLFAPIWAARRLMKVAKPSIKSEAELNAPLLNRALGTIFDFDVASAAWLRPPFGVSLLVLARKSSFGTS